MQNQTKMKKAGGALPSSTTEAPRIEEIALDRIVAEAETQVRAVIQPVVVDQYASTMNDPAAQFPPVVVFDDGKQYILADGFHRVAAARRIGRKTIRAEIRQGTHVDALAYALRANTGEGLARTYKDKRRSVALALAQWPDLSTREIARICAVSDPFVATWRRKGQPLGLDPIDNPERRPRFLGRPRPAARHSGPGSDRQQIDESEQKRLKYLAETWPATCPQCEQEFRFDKRQPEPSACPACSAETRDCRLCGKPFEGTGEFCSERCKKWHGEHGARAE